MALILKGLNNYKQFLIISTIITFYFKEFLGLKHYQILVFLSIITRINLLRNSPSNYKF
jgi:hypothetical protein